VTLMKRVADKLDLMSWALFRDEVLPTLPRKFTHTSTRTNILR